MYVGETFNVTFRASNNMPVYTNCTFYASNNENLFYNFTINQKMVNGSLVVN